MYFVAPSRKNCIINGTKSGIGGIGELLVIPDLKAHISDTGHLVLTDKFLSGMSAYAERWPGAVTAMLMISDTPDSNLDHVEISPGVFPFNVESTTGEQEALATRMRQASIVLGGSLRVAGARQVGVKEYSICTQRQIISADVSSYVRRWKRSIEAIVLDWQERCVAGQLAGIQCNGIPTYSIFKKLNPNTMLFFDSRIEENDLIALDALGQRATKLLAGGPLRLTFTGRLVRRKGADVLPEVAAELRRLGVRFEMSICGGGECEQQIARDLREKALEGHVRMLGVLKYREKLLPFVRENVDLFVCPHVQGDPSCTYIETMACGVPIVGYANEAWEGMAELSRAGWVTPMKNPKLLAARIAELDQNRQALVDAAKAARTFAAEHLFERTIDRRIEHMLSCLQPPQ